VAGFRLFIPNNENRHRFDQCPLSTPSLNLPPSFPAFDESPTKMRRRVSHCLDLIAILGQTPA
jgi:hypothetical protein